MSLQPEICELLDYFTHLYNSGASYSVLNSSKCALYHILFSPPYSSILEHQKTIKYFKDVYNFRPPTLLRILFDYFSHKGEIDQLPDNSLTQ